METLDNVKELIALVRKGSFLQAIERFYAQDATMQENLDSPRAGLPALLSNERRVLATLPDIHLERVGWFIVNGDRAAINWVFAYTAPDGRKVELDEVASQEWHHGKIVRERFYYDPAQRLRGLN